MSSEKEQNEVKFLEKIENFSKIFDSIESFTNFYNLHKKEMDTFTTQKLNKLYKITEGDKNYRITKLRGQISLKRIDQETKTDRYQDQIDTLANKVKQIEQKLKVVTDTVNKMADVINNRFT